YDDLPLDDPKVYAIFSEGRTESVFQFESGGMQRMLREAKPTRLEDLIALNAMFRPGPMENIPSFCLRKNGKEPVSYPHPLLERVLGETYGIMVYQEQVMEAAQVMGGYSLGGADLLRRAMGKKKLDEMAKHRAIFREGAAKKEIPAAVADEVFSLMLKFAGYGFNKSHAAAYSLLAYHTAWIKVHFPAEFFAANMTVELDNSDKLKALLVDARTFGVTIAAPDINSGTYRFEPVSERAVRYGLGAVKGTGQGAIEAIVAAREAGGPFTSLFDFCARVDRGRINRRVVEALIKAGAFDALHGERSSLLASVGLALDWADTQAAHADQGGLFDFGADAGDTHGASTHEPALVAAAPWSIKERLTLEKSALGFYLSGHLFDQSAAEVRRFAKLRLADVLDSREPLLLAGIVSDLRVVNGQRGRVAIFQLDDASEAMEAVAHEELLAANRDLLKDDELVIVQGKVQPDRFSGGVRLNVQSVWDLAGARCRFGKYLRVEVNGSVPPVAEVLRDFPSRRVLTEHGELPQGLAVRLALLREHASGEIDLGDSARFYPSEAALARWNAAAAHGRAIVVYD
ncbi:MAG: DNA polymerase III subunit alpha, partial [Caldimonas sp.]